MSNIAALRLQFQSPPQVLPTLSFYFYFVFTSNTRIRPATLTSKASRQGPSPQQGQSWRKTVESHKTRDSSGLGEGRGGMAALPPRQRRAPPGPARTPHRGGRPDPAQQSAAPANEGARAAAHPLATTAPRGGRTPRRPCPQPTLEETSPPSLRVRAWRR